MKIKDNVAVLENDHGTLILVEYVGSGYQISYVTGHRVSRVVVASMAALKARLELTDRKAVDLIKALNPTVPDQFRQTGRTTAIVDTVVARLKEMSTPKVIFVVDHPSMKQYVSHLFFERGVDPRRQVAFATADEVRRGVLRGLTSVVYYDHTVDPRLIEANV